MSNATVRRLAFVVAGLVLLLGPLFVRAVFLGYNRRPYTPADVPPLSVAATPGPTAVPSPQPAAETRVSHDLRPGPVIVDLAHGNRIERSRFEPLAAALANRGVGVRFWMSDVDPMTITNFLEYPDQSEELEPLLRGASALVVVSPFFLWSKAEIALAEQFVADGGRLLLISDPDVIGDLAQDINNLAEPFGVVFADDYLYDTVENDGNYVYVFQSGFVEDAAFLEGSRIAFYGTRSIVGDVTPQLFTSQTTLSSMREGVTGLSTVVKGGLASRGTDGGVLAMGDFDVMTAPFVERHDNLRVTEFVADFLTSGERTKGVTDFPAWLGKDVTLVFANADAVDAEILAVGSELQRSLEQTGRTLAVAGAGVLTPTLAGETTADPDADLIVLADFAMADSATTLLSDLGFELVEVVPTPEATGAAAESDAEEEAAEDVATETPAPTEPTAPTAAPTRSATPETTPTATAAPSSSIRSQFSAPAAPQQADETPAALLTPTATFTPTPAPTSTPTETPTPAPTSTPQPEVYLQTADGLRLVAAETVLIAQMELTDGRRLVAVLGKDNDGIRSGVDRLLDGDFTGCMVSADLAVCSGPAGEGGTQPSHAAIAGPVTKSESSPLATETVTPRPEGPGSKLVMVVDDNDVTLPGEISEADIYLQVLTQEGYGPTLWMTAGDGIPTLDDLSGYDWVIWSAGGYESGGPGLADLDSLLAYINKGGFLTVSSQRPFFGMSANEPSVIADVAVASDLPALVQGLPSTPIQLENGLPPVTPLEISEDHAGAKVALVRGPDSGDAGAPLLFVVSDDTGPDATGARVMVLGMPLAWLPDDFGQQLVRNMTAYMLAD